MLFRSLRNVISFSFVGFEKLVHNPNNRIVVMDSDNFLIIFFIIWNFCLTCTYVRLFLKQKYEK